jgi:hypothetical protein
LLQVLLQAMQHPYGSLLMQEMGADQMMAAVSILDELKDAQTTTPTLMRGVILNAENVLNLAGVMLALES